jgi:hypothetical protein
MDNLMRSTAQKKSNPRRGMFCSRLGVFLNDPEKKNLEVLFFMENIFHRMLVSPLTGLTPVRNAFSTKWRVVLCAVKMKVSSLLIGLFCSYPTRNPVHNIFQPIVVNVNMIDVAAPAIPR